MSAAAMRTYPNIVQAWGLRETEAALLLGVPRSTYRRWRRTPERAKLDINHLERMSLILGIYKALQILLPRTDSADSWLRRPNRNLLFAGTTPLERLCSGLVQDLYVIRQYLDAARGGAFA
ncbi:MbcA/ParS/Xre antitoxin family protein [Halomonas sp. PGE1]|uniref:antitoxin Xre-like helix-turn-helix domain-containing protein n=1 Tax=Halomonas sp. PGE1 TaxID=2730360 RepID=UPI001472CEEA